MTTDKPKRVPKPKPKKELKISSKDTIEWVELTPPFVMFQDISEYTGDTIERYMGIDPSLKGPASVILEVLSTGKGILTVKMLNETTRKEQALINTIANNLSCRISANKRFDYIFLEDYAHSRGHQAHTMGELGHALRYMLGRTNFVYALAHMQPIAFVVGIGSWKNALGLPGNCAKIDVQMFLAKRYQLFIKSEDVSDAIGIALAAYVKKHGELPNFPLEVIFT